TIASKNNFEDVRPMLEGHPGMLLTLSHFAAHRVNWQSKADNIREIARELNIGLDSLVFLDDSPVERAHVRSALPQVLTLELPKEPERYREALLALDVFETLAITDEDRQRSQLYAEQQIRNAFVQQAQSTGTLEQYLTELDISVEIHTMQ